MWRAGILKWVETHHTHDQTCRKFQCVCQAICLNQPLQRDPGAFKPEGNSNFRHRLLCPCPDLLLQLAPVTKAGDSPQRWSYMYQQVCRCLSATVTNMSMLVNQRDNSAWVLFLLLCNGAANMLLCSVQIRWTLASFNLTGLQTKQWGLMIYLFSLKGSRWLQESRWHLNRYWVLL